MAEFWYNAAHHLALGCSPFKALYGYDPPVLAVPEPYPPVSASVQEWVQAKEAHNTMLKQMLATAQNKMKQQADKKCSDRVFQVGESFLLKLQPYAQHSVVNRPCPKLAYKYYGPFPVLKRICTAAYHLDLPPDSLIHPVFHVSQLKPFTPNYTPVYSSLPRVVDLEKDPLNPEAVLQHRLVKRGNSATPQVLVKWANMPENSAT